jgi:hypothetical protein
MWSFWHYAFIVSPFILLLPLYYLTRSKDKASLRKIGIILSIIAIIILLLRNIEIWVRGNYALNIEMIPLQICHFANFVLLIAFITNKQSWFNFALLLNLPAAFVSIIFANSLSNYDTILTFRGFAYIVGHMLLVTIPIWFYLVGFVEVNFNRFKSTVKLVGIFYFISIFINNVMYLLLGQYANYFYALKPESGTPLEWFYELGENIYIGVFKFNPIYLLLTGLFGLLVMYLLYLLFYTFNKKKKTI